MGKPGKVNLALPGGISTPRVCIIVQSFDVTAIGPACANCARTTHPQTADLKLIHTMAHSPARAAVPEPIPAGMYYQADWTPYTQDQPVYSYRPWLRTDTSQYWTGAGSEHWPSPTYAASYAPGTQVPATTQYQVLSATQYPLRCKLGFIVYRLAPGMFHSGVVVNDTEEWHFWEGAGIKRLKRPLIDGHYFPAVSDLEVVEDSEVGCINFAFDEVVRYCEGLKQTQFNPATYNLLRNNCNHFVQSIMERFGKAKYLPSYINRPANVARFICCIVPGAERFIDSLRGR
eukprot:Blabericola_migrator_1__1728@NODE_1464_length_4502_cov_13_265614_g964_i0_p3_GENE_NODE_1464_length_4502_cov_13_265614_g964_i0NODE_1464_length_4502_cov_13_265614_g964_i0_p3_ORF_typecomplete_len288_score1_57Peptidase_C97/PF05903_14/7e17LRAT/PF04970_13/7_1e06DUF778/PF05608_12/0_0011DUF4796/PF16044_5/4_4e03DUF4796/PF16044_5/0_097_NODE_1464_length_4502_cov_13_265614_g964_i026463509